MEVEGPPQTPQAAVPVEQLRSSDSATLDFLPGLHMDL